MELHRRHGEANGRQRALPLDRFLERADGEKPTATVTMSSKLRPPRASRSGRFGNAAGDASLPRSKRLADTGLARTVYIRAEPHSVVQAINRQIAHYACHVGQIRF
jgi:hypothetical protein